MTAGLGLMGGQVTADVLELTGTIRDIKRGDQAGGHPDFQTAGAAGKFGHIKGLVGMDLGADNKPVYCTPRPSSKDTIQSATSLSKWYNDVAGENMSSPMTLTLTNGQEAPGGVYTYASCLFFPIDGQMLGNQGLSHNFHFTFELHYAFTYEPGQLFTFTGDDDVWVYVNNIKVIDLGGVHAAVTGKFRLFDGKAFVEKSHFTTGGVVQEVSSAMAADLATKWTQQGLSGTCPILSGDKYINLGLVTGQDCKFDFFFAERHTTQSNFRIDTTIKLQAPNEVTALYD
jgi:fibro-slime domain-containing protein